MGHTGNCQNKGNTNIKGLSRALGYPKPRATSMPLVYILHVSRTVLEGCDTMWGVVEGGGKPLLQNLPVFNWVEIWLRKPRLFIPGSNLHPLS